MYSDNSTTVILEFTRDFSESGSVTFKFRGFVSFCTKLAQLCSFNVSFKFRKIHKKIQNVRTVQFRHCYSDFGGIMSNWSIFKGKYGFLKWTLCLFTEFEWTIWTQVVPAFNLFFCVKRCRNLYFFFSLGQGWNSEAPQNLEMFLSKKNVEHKVSVIGSIVVSSLHAWKILGFCNSLPHTSEVQPCRTIFISARCNF